MRFEYLLACCRYVELNPLRSGMVEDPSQYFWSSCPAKTGIREQSWLDFDPFYMSLGNTSDERAKKYGRWLRKTVPEEEWKLIREATQREHGPVVFTVNSFLACPLFAVKFKSVRKGRTANPIDSINFVRPHVIRVHPKSNKPRSLPPSWPSLGSGYKTAARIEYNKTCW